MPQETLAASPAAEQLRRGHAWLRFRSVLESSYRQDQFRHGLFYLRASLGIGALVVAVFALLDRFVLHIVHEPLVELVRYAVLLPAIVLALTVTFLRDGSRLYRPVVSFLAPFGLVAIVALVLSAWENGQDQAFTALILATMFVYFLIGLPFMAGLVTNLIAAAAYLGGALLLAMPGQELTYNIFMLVLAIAVGATTAYNVEHTRRTAWLESKVLDEAALRDGLTGIYNRRRFDEHLAQVWKDGVREHRPIALLMADIDHFKAFNDRYGHQAGDEAMKSVAVVLTRFARRPLDLVARYGGEEFAIVLFDTTQEHAAQVAEQLLEEVRGLGIPHHDSSAAAVLTISIGIACVLPVARRSSAGLLQLADQALYGAKDAGRNRSQLLHEEYEHMKTGYFRRHMPDSKAGQ
ncbi:MAG: GGDEF domain-containing protein [Gammaproteobacteria bacterium]|nr:GGDEF domain-containing protein [Gammaproteobacteria bacterium]